MCRKTFAAIAALAAFAPLRAQQLPGRDLFRLPLGAMGEAPALATAAGGGFWNPATLALPASDALRVSIVSLNTPDEQGITSLLGTAAYRIPRSRFTIGASVAQADVGDLLRTDTDPQSMGPAIQYSSLIASGIATASYGPGSVGVALRRRYATIDAASGHTTSLDIGGTLDRPAGLPVRVAASSFLLSRYREVEKASGMAAIEAYLPWTTNDLRGGVSYQLDEGGGDERFIYGSGRVSMLELRGGIASQQAYGYSTTRLRLGVGLHYGTYVVGIAREDGTAGLTASYQFLLTMSVPRVSK